MNTNNYNLDIDIFFIDDKTLIKNHNKFQSILNKYVNTLTNLQETLLYNKKDINKLLYLNKKLISLGNKIKEHIKKINYNDSLLESNLLEYNSENNSQLQYLRYDEKQLNKFKETIIEDCSNKEHYNFYIPLFIIVLLMGVYFITNNK